MEVKFTVLYPEIQFLSPLGGFSRVVTKDAEGKIVETTEWSSKYCAHITYDDKTCCKCGKVFKEETP